MKDIFSPELLSFTFQINLIKKWISKVIQTVYYFVNKEKYCQICFCLVWFYFTLLVCAHFCGDANYERRSNILIFCDQWKMISDLSVFHGKMSDFDSFPMIGFTLVTKRKNFDFESHWNTLIFQISQIYLRFEYVLQTVSDLV